MKSSQWPKANIWLSVYAVAAFLWGVFIVWQRLPDQLLIALIIPILIAPFSYSRYVYMVMLAIMAAVAIWVTRTISTDFITSLKTIGMILLAVILQCEATSHIATSRAQAEKRLRLTQFTVDRASQAIVWIDPQGTLVYANESACQLAGTIREDLVGKKMWEYAKDFDPERWQVHWEEVKRKKTLTLETTSTTASGDIVWNEIHVNYLRFNSLEYLINYSRDITERKKAEAYLQNANAELEMRVQERTASLMAANARLEEEIAVRKQAEAELEQHRNRLEIMVTERSARLEDANQQLLAEIDERRQAQSETQHQSEFTRTILDTIPNLVFVKDVDGAYVMVNNALTQAYNEPAHQIIGKRDADFFTDPREIEYNHQTDQIVLQGHHPINYEGAHKAADGTQRWFSITKVPLQKPDGTYQVLGIATDITERRAIEERLFYLSTNDPLTGVFNRTLFEAEMERLQNGRLFPVSILVVDVNGLKDINDRFGHAAGDELLKGVAWVLMRSFRAEDVVARVGGDEFAVLLPEMDETACQEAIKRVWTNLDIFNQGQPVTQLQISVGVATCQKGCSLTETLHLADENMYTFKTASKNKNLQETSSEGPVLL